MKRVFTGPEQGPGATYDFAGNSKVGSGRVMITDSAPPTRVALTLDMITPIETHNVIEFRLEPNGNDTIVTWTMQGSATFIAKLLNVFIDIDQMVGDDFEDGLASLKAAAEK